MSTLTNTTAQALAERVLKGDKPMTGSQWDSIVTYATGNRFGIAATLYAAKTRGVVGFETFTEMRDAMAERAGRSGAALSQWTTAYGVARKALGARITEADFNAALTAYGKGKDSRDALNAAVREVTGKTKSAAPMSSEDFHALCERASKVEPAKGAKGAKGTGSAKGPRVPSSSVATRTADWITSLREVVTAAGGADTSNVALTSDDAAVVADLIARLLDVTGVTPARMV